MMRRRMPFEKKMPLPFFTQVNSNMPVIAFEKFTDNELGKFLTDKGLKGPLVNLVIKQKITGKMILESTQASLEHSFTKAAAGELMRAVKDYQGGKEKRPCFDLVLTLLTLTLF